LAGNDRPLDDVDERLLTLLEKNARLPVVSLAKAVGLSRSAVQDRLARLEDSGHIAGYTVLRGRPRHRPRLRALLLLGIETRPCALVLSRFQGWPEVRACWSLAGQIDAAVLVETEDAEQLGELRNRLAAVPGVASVTTAPILNTVVERP
jgi:DNA-binding Lrp family transcriptional regulator